MNLNELISTSKTSVEEFKKILMVFLPFAHSILEFNSKPKIILKSTIVVDQQPTFGRFFNDGSNEIEIAISDRHPVDILRTLAHELVHCKQAEKTTDLDPTTGSVHENEANEVAGVIMRKFNKAHPEFLTFKSVE